MNATLGRAAVLMLLAALPGCSMQAAPASATFKDIDYEIDGTVLEGGTGVPLAGAYVALMYTNPGDTDDPHHSRDRRRMVCLKVKGAYVDAEGHFKLPAEKVDDLVAYRLIVIKPDHYIVEKTMPATSSAKHGGKPRVEVRFDVDPRSAPAGPERRGEDDRRYLFEPSLDCWHARFREDAAPAIPFLEILRGELPKHDLGNEGRNAKGDVALAGHVIYLLNSLPSRADSGSVAERSSSSEKALSSNREATGTVFDAATKQPVQGAYVIATYIIVRGRYHVCWRTRGQVTGADGKFRFPVEKTDGGNPEQLHALLADHYTKNEGHPTESEWNDGAFYRGRDIYLAKQDPGNPSPRFYYGEMCMPEFKTLEDGVAYGEFTSRVDAETEKYFKKVPFTIKLTQ